MVELTVLDPVWSKVSQPSSIKGLLSYDKQVWVRGKYKREKKTYRQTLVHRDGKFLTGFVEKVQEHLGNDCIIEKCFDVGDFGIVIQEPHLEGITLRQDQLHAIHTALKKTRGVLIAPTGAGKTILMAGLMSCFPDTKKLVLVHTIDLVDQAINEFSKFGFQCSKMGGGKKDCDGEVVVSTIQTFSKLNHEILLEFDAVFIDEGHHLGKIDDKGMYYQVLTKLDAPYRFAFTATLPDSEESKLCMEGLIGGVINELSFDDAINLGIVVKPEIRLVKVSPYSSDLYKYKDIYEHAIVHNRERNFQIIKTIRKLNREGLSTLTYVQRIEHINNLLSIAKEFYTPVYDVQGMTDSEIRMKLKKHLENKEIMNVIATVVWREGINIKSLNCIIIAGGGKNEKDLIQACGRGARKDEGKEKFIIVDFIDSAKYLSQHFCERLGVYVKKGWL